MSLKKTMENSYRNLYEHGTEFLRQADVPDAALDARLLLEWCCHTDQNTYLAHPERPLSEAELAAYLDCLAKRADRMPLQYITNEQEFMGLPFFVDERVLVPRQDTEILAEEALRYLHDGMRILDLCTGSGCILLSLLQYSNDCIGVGTDCSAAALDVARKNAAALGERKPMQVSFLQGDLYAALEGHDEKFDMMVSNPPYIPAETIDGLMPEVSAHEPRLALDGGADGLAFYRRIVSGAADFLTGGGRIFLEIGSDQQEAVEALLRAAGFSDIQTIRDLAKLPRVVSACLPIL